MRRRRNPFGNPRRTRKVRSAISVKEKPAPRKARCTACRHDIAKGETAVYVRVRTRRFHKGCAPANVGTPAAAQSPSGAPTMPTEQKAAMAFAVEALENALAAKARAVGITPEMEKSYDKYNKIKELALRPGTQQEGATALRMALIEIIKATV